MAIQTPTGDFVTSTLASAINNSATTATIGTGLTLPAAGGVLQIDYDSSIAVGTDSGPETITYSAYTTATGALTGITRGCAGTTAVAHDSGASVQCGPSVLYVNNSEDGWLNPFETWAYASATTITVPSGAASTYSVGDKIRFQNNDSGTYLYAYIITVADTLLTVVGDAVPNATLTDNYYSKSTSPVGFPDWFAWTPTLTGGDADLSAFTTARFKIDGKCVRFNFYANGKNVTGSAGSIQITLPVAATSTVTSYPLTASGYDGAAYTLFYSEISTAVSTAYLRIWKDNAATNWAANETGVVIGIEGFYEIP